MMFPEIDASAYGHSSIIYHEEFEEVLSKIIACYNRMLRDNVNLSNNENSIRDYMLYNYLKKQWFKKQYEVTNYLFDPELPENNGRIDIRIMPINPFVNDDAYFVIECKRIDSKNRKGTSGLNSEYIKEGIDRFVNSKYTSYYRTNGMIGFVVETMNISENIVDINDLMKGTMNVTQELFYREITTDFNFSYCSTHSVNTHEITIYHLMFNFANNIK